MADRREIEEFLRNTPARHEEIARRIREGERLDQKTVEAIKYVEGLRKSIRHGARRAPRVFKP